MNITGVSVKSGSGSETAVDSLVTVAPVDAALDSPPPPWLASPDLELHTVTVVMVGRVTVTVDTQLVLVFSLQGNLVSSLFGSKITMINKDQMKLTSLIVLSHSYRSVIAGGAGN